MGNTPGKLTVLTVTSKDSFAHKETGNNDIHSPLPPKKGESGDVRSTTDRCK